MHIFKGSQAVLYFYVGFLFTVTISTLRVNNTGDWIQYKRPLTTTMNIYIYECNSIKIHLLQMNKTAYLTTQYILTKPAMSHSFIAAVVLQIYNRLTLCIAYALQCCTSSIMPTERPGMLFCYVFLTLHSIIHMWWITSCETMSTWDGMIHLFRLIQTLN